MAGLPQKRPSCSEAIASAMEHADDMESILILYETKDGCEQSTGSFENEELTVGAALFLLETYKHWLLGQMLEKD